ncbi:phosphonate metabolism transcriptional regulator PhnF [Bauldia sp.]|uniref:phosphonate metabolism transcriptional regulator PhnF n=1 Tax=Bauldia sp. TaxID=2575872 RepID=UPI003BA9F72D
MDATNSVSWRDVYVDLKRQIDEGDFAPGARLPAQATLARSFRVTRHAVRRALQTMERDQLVVSWQGRGTFVADERFQYQIGQRTRFGENMRAEGRVSATKFLGSRLRPGPARIAELLGVSRRERVHIAEILRFVDARPAVLARHYFDPRRFPKIVGGIQRTGSVTDALIDEDVEDFFRKTTIVETRNATSTEAVLLDIAPTQPVLVVTGHNVDRAGNPVEVAEAIARGDRISLVLQSVPTPGRNPPNSLLGVKN